MLAGANNDTAQWDPGDGNDTIEGQDGRDKLVFNGTNINERIDVAANGGRVRFTRDIASITMDLNDVEEIDHNALGGADVTTINDMSGTDLTDFRDEPLGNDRAALGRRRRRRGDRQRDQRRRRDRHLRIASTGRAT